MTVLAEDFLDFGEVLVEGGGFGVLEPVGPMVGVALETPAVEVEVDGGLVGSVADGDGGGVGGVSGGAGIGVLGGGSDESGGQGIAFGVNQGVAIVTGGLDAVDAEAVFPEVAIALLGAVDPAGMVGLELLHEAGNAIPTSRFEDEVDVVGHEAEGVDADGVAPGKHVKALKVDEELDFGVEDRLTVVAALVDMVDLATLPIAQSGGGFQLFIFSLHVE